MLKTFGAFTTAGYGGAVFSYELHPGADLGKDEALAAAATPVGEPAPEV